MNDVVFAGKLSRFESEGAQKFNKCLKVLLPERDGAGGVVKSDKADYSYSSGDYVVIPPFARYELQKPKDGDEIVCIEQPLIPSSLSVSVISNALHDGMRGAAQQAVFYAEEKNFNPAVLSALGQLIAAYVCDDCAVTYHPVVQSLKAVIESNFTDSTFSADTAISKIPLNGDYVRKIFKKQTGVTPHEYLIRTRLERAENILSCGVSNKYSELTVSQIAEACGFAEPLYFSRVFKKYYGVAPSAYAKKTK